MKYDIIKLFDSDLTMYYDIFNLYDIKLGIILGT